MCLALSMVAGLSATACLTRGATLQARWVRGVPEPNQLIETDLWGPARPVVVKVSRGTGRTAEWRHVQLRAIHDDRALSILARWYDDTPDQTARWWTWDPSGGRYRLVEEPGDWIAIRWPLAGTASTDPLAYREGRFDLWRWRAGWTDASGIADDMVLHRRPTAVEDRPATCGETVRYRARTDPGLVELTRRMDPGRPGTQPTDRPWMHERPVMPGLESVRATGSAADVQALGLYDRPESYREFERYTGPAASSIHLLFDPALERAHGSWSVEFHRLLVTGDKQNDRQMRGAEPCRLAIEVLDARFGEVPFSSGPIRLILESEPD